MDYSMATKSRRAAWTALHFSFVFLYGLRLVSGWGWQQFVNPNNNFAKVLSIPPNVKILILPGFGNDSSDYVLEEAPQGSLVASLEKRGWDRDKQIRILPVQRSDWLQVFTKGVFDTAFWQGTAPPTRPAFRWYLERIIDCVNEMTRTNNEDDSNNNAKVVLLGHSAGGWLARAAVGYGYFGDDENKFPSCLDLKKIGGIVTLGSPHFPPPPEIMDMTRGALSSTATAFPGAFHDELLYITIIGEAVKGVKQDRKSPFEPTSVTGFAYNSYRAVCGDGEEIGDGVVPSIAGHLDGAVQLSLDGIFHSINVPDLWYGSDTVIDKWHQEMITQICRERNDRKPLIDLQQFDIFR